MRPSLRAKIDRLPEDPGIYLFLGDEGEALYVGKANSLRKRVLAYTKVEADPRLGTMVREAVDLDFVVTASEADALLLENNFIKKRQPRFNIRLRDDKTYPYLKLTLADEYPRIAFTRRIVDDGAQYFGPFLPGGLARRAIKVVQKLFQVRVCRIEIDGKLPRPCLYHDMKRCLAPCVAGLTDREEYSLAVDRARRFLAGRTDELSAELRSEMNRAAEELRFEEAARLRDLLHEVSATSQRHQLSSKAQEDVDIFGVCLADNKAAVVALVMRGGQVLDRRELFFEDALGASPSELLDELLPQIYANTTFIPDEVHLPLEIEGQQGLEEWLSDRKGRRVRVVRPQRGTKADRSRLADDNAQMAYRRRFRLAAEGDPGALVLRDALDLKEVPQRIEGFDISTFHGRQTVASMVVWENGSMQKRAYRSFNIRGLPHHDDFASMQQAIERRYQRVLAETGEMPDLILVDGGPGQVTAALRAFEALGVEEQPLVGLAKKEEELFVPGHRQSIRLSRRSPGLQLLQRIRDESHRFAITRHRRRRSRSGLRSRFDELKGVGEKRRKLLIRTFGSYRGVQEATRDQLIEALGQRVGESVWEQVHQDPSQTVGRDGQPSPASAGPEAGTPAGDGEPPLS